MHGFRGSEHAVDLLTPYEMLLQYSMERILPPSSMIKSSRAPWTVDGIKYCEQCQRTGVKPRLQPGIPYVALPAHNRLLLPDLPALCGLRHRWCWELRSRPHLPVWSFAKVPRADFSVEENSRLLSVYMRPWTLNPQDSVASNQLLLVLGKCCLINHRWIPVWSCWRSTSSSNLASVAHATPVSDISGAAQAKAESLHAVIETACGVGPPQKRFRLSKKTSRSSRVMTECLSYVTLSQSRVCDSSRIC